MLMVEELTIDATDLKSIATQFQNGIEKASETYNKAVLESKIDTARMR